MTSRVFTIFAVAWNLILFSLWNGLVTHFTGCALVLAACLWSLGVVLALAVFWRGDA